MTTNNLIGYDPLAWLDEESVEETAIVEPVKKTTRQKTKAKAKETPVIATESAELETAENTAQIVGEIVEESNDDDVAIDVSIDKDGEIEINVVSTEKTEVCVDVTFESEENDNNPLETLDSEENETPQVDEIIDESENVEVDAMPEETVAPVIELGSEASLKTLATLYTQCKKVLAAHDVIEINASEVTTIDTATFQLLVSLKKDAPNLGKTIHVVSPSARFVESAKLLDLVTVLEVDN